MSKQKKMGDIKDNNISSKLLGANLSDLTIQKFRDVGQMKREKYELGGKCSISMLKSISNKFSPLVIFTVTLSSQAISNIEALAECTNLMVLDLNHNAIENIAPLNKLLKLRIVDLAHNLLDNVDALGSCKELVNLHIEGNMIKGIDQLRALTDCPQLKNLHLQTLTAHDHNPVCELVSYRSNVTETLAQLRRLDSVPVGIEFHNGSEIKEAKKKELKIEIKNIGPFYTNKFPTVPVYTPPVFLEEQSLKKSMANCKSAIQELEMRMRVLLAS